MVAIRQQYIAFISWPDTQPKAIKIEDRDVSKVVMPDKYTYAFWFFERVEGTVEINGEMVELASSRRDESPVYYYGAKMYTRKEYASKKPVRNWKEILSYVRKMGWENFMVIRSGEVFQCSGEEIIVNSEE